MSEPKGKRGAKKAPTSDATKPETSTAAKRPARKRAATKSESAAAPSLDFAATPAGTGTTGTAAEPEQPTVTTMDGAMAGETTGGTAATAETLVQEQPTLADQAERTESFGDFGTLAASELSADTPTQAQPTRSDEPVTQAQPVRGDGSPAVDEFEIIRTRAYLLFRERGGAPGYELEDWLRAEREFRERFGR